MFRERTVHVIVCDTPDCGTVYRFYDPDADERFELRLDNPDLTTWRQSLIEDGWHVGTEVLCPPCATAHDDAVLDRMATELEQEPLWDDGDLAEDDSECWWRISYGPPPRPIETVPISIDDWPLET